MVRSFDEEMKFLDKVTPTCWKIKQGFVPNMNVCSPVHYPDLYRACRRKDFRSQEHSLPGGKMYCNFVFMYGTSLPGCMEGISAV